MDMDRASGILLHPSSLPGEYGIGSLGREAYAFVDFLAASGQSYWQVLPLGPTGYGDSPYSTFSAFAGNPLLISLEQLTTAGDLEAGDLAELTHVPGPVDYGFVHDCMSRLLPKAAKGFFLKGSPERRQAFAAFCHEQSFWLDDFALFQALRGQFAFRPWNEWPEALRQRQPKALRSWQERLAEPVAAQKYTQFVFFEQWFALKTYARKRGIRLIGDLPIFVAYDSSDVWGNPHLFRLDDRGRPAVVAGVPPDYFSATGQRWGNPLYNWEAMAAMGFGWWKARLHWCLIQADVVRIDHFRGFAACWEIPAEEPTAINGRWVPVPGGELFQELTRTSGMLPVIAEDLGVITPDVEQLRDRFAFPGMKILQFAFDSGPDNPYLPHNYLRHCVVYTGTHDNNTTAGWWQSLQTTQREQVCAYLGHPCRDMPWDLVHLAAASVAKLAIYPLQDLLGLPASARMNCPGQSRENWRWRYPKGALTEELALRLHSLTERFGRLPRPAESNVSPLF